MNKLLLLLLLLLLLPWLSSREHSSKKCHDYYQTIHARFVRNRKDEERLKRISGGKGRESKCGEFSELLTNIQFAFGGGDTTHR